MEGLVQQPCLHSALLASFPPAACGSPTHHIVQLYTILEAELLKILLGCMDSSRETVSCGPMMTAPCGKLTVGPPEGFEQRISIHSNNRHGDRRGCCQEMGGGGPGPGTPMNVIKALYFCEVSVQRNRAHTTPQFSDPAPPRPRLLAESSWRVHNLHCVAAWSDRTTVCCSL